MHNKFFLMLSLITMFLAGCESMQNKPSTPETQDDATSGQIDHALISAESLLEYSNRFMALSREAQKEELSAVNRRLAQNKHDLNDRTKAAIVSLLADSSDIQDKAKAQTLLDDLVRENDPDIERKTLAKILRDFLAEQTKLSRENNRLNQKMHDEQKRAETLQQKLEELKNIERNIVDRKVLDK